MPLENEDKIPYGFLNPIDSMYGPNKAIYNTDNQPFQKTLSEIARDRFSSDILAGGSDFTAISLGIVPSDYPKDSMFEALTMFGLPVQENSQIRVYARIPEIHSHLPSPRGPEDFDIIRMYPIFVGDPGLEPPIYGDLVKVSFKNVYNQQGPIYIGTQFGGNKLNAQPSGNGSAAGTSMTGATNTPNSGSATNYVQQPLTPNDPKYKEKLEASMLNVYRPVGRESKNGIKYPLTIIPKGAIFQEFKRDKNILNSIVLHESIHDSMQVTERSLLKGGEGVGYGVHFTIDLDAKVYSYNDPKVQLIHMPGINPRSIGIEIINRYHAFGMLSTDKRDVVQGKWIIHTDRDPQKQTIYTVPTNKQLEACFKLVKNLCLNYNIPIAYPSVINGNYIWGLSPGILMAAGISSHHHIGGHADGTFIEFYTLCRFNDFSAEDAYKKSIELSKTTKRKQPVQIPVNNIVIPSGKFGN